MFEADNLKNQVEPIIREVGEIQLRYFKKARLLKRHEKNGAGFCTEADIESEKFLIEKLSQIISGAAFFAEETGLSGSGDYRWVIDPLDGTINFAHGLPYFCISVALTYKDDAIFGMIYQPVLNELFWAQKGQGSWLNGKKINVASAKSLNEALLVIGLPYDARDDYKRYLQQISTVVPNAYTFRYMGAAALDLAYVACGRFDGHFFSGLSWWDFAAGDLLLREAGGKTSDFDGNLIDLDSKTFVGGNMVVHKVLLDLLGR